MKPAEVLALPQYLGLIMLGALSPDHTRLSMTEKDVERYPGIKRWRQPHRNLNAIG